MGSIVYYLDTQTKVDHSMSVTTTYIFLSQ